LRACTRLHGQEIDGTHRLVTQIEPSWHGAPHNTMPFSLS
jgi:hypothetical protein